MMLVLRRTLYAVGLVLWLAGLPINGYAQSAQTITFRMLSDRPLGSSPPTLSASASSGLPVTFASQSPSVCTVAGANLNFVTTGACLIRATQEGNAQFLPAPAVTQGFSIFSTTQSAALRGAINLDDSGRTPILVRSGSAQFQVAKFTNNTFQLAPLSDPGSGYRLIGIGDFDGNGRSDLAFQNMTQGIFGDIKIWRDFSSSNEVYWRQVKQVWDVQAAGDMDGDGFSDLVWRYVVSESSDTGVSYIWFTNGSGVTQVRKRGGAPLDWQLLGAADLNGDRAADMVYINPSNQLRVLMATPNRTCANLAATSLPTGFSALKLADFTGKGRADVLIRNSSGQLGLLSLNAVGLALPAYTGTPDDQNAACTASSLTVETESVSLPAVDPAWQFFAAGDFNGDGIVDIAWVQPSRTLSVWLMNAAGSSPTIVNNAGTVPAGFSVFSGEKSSATLAPAPTNPLTVAGITPSSVTCTAAPCGQTFSISGAGLANVNSVTLQWAGAKGRGSSTWTPGAVDWNSRVSLIGNNAMSISPTLVEVGEESGATTWTVFLGTSSGQTASMAVSVNYDPPPPPPPIPSAGNFVGTFGLGSAISAGADRYLVFQLTNARFGNPVSGANLTNETTPFASVAVSSGGSAGSNSVIFQVIAGPSGAGPADVLKFVMNNVVPLASGATLTYTLHELLPQAMAGLLPLASGSVTLESIRVP